MVLESALHTADLANPSKPLQTCLAWTERVVNEFYVQGDEERKLGIPISLMCDRFKPNVERSQIGFIDAIVKPLYVVFAQIVPELKVIHHIVAHLFLYIYHQLGWL
jgi:cAMP-specific phosphodiesterase 4